MDRDKLISVPYELVEAVAYIGLDFGYGEYQLEQKWIDMAREIFDGEIKQEQQTSDTYQEAANNE